MFLLVVLFSCGGGGGSSGGSNAPTIKKTNLSLSWNFPTERENQQPLSPEDIQGCVIVYLRGSDLQGQPTVFPGHINSLEDFTDKNSQIGHFISGAEIPEIISEGSVNAILILSSEISNYTFLDVDPDTYYFSVSCSDWDDLYSELSTTVSVNVP